MSRQSLLLIFCLLALSTIAAAQPKDASKVEAKTSADKNKSAKALEAERILAERRANAQSLLINLAVDARNFNDQTLRARTLARIADALWEVDRERGRTLFRASWDSAEIADKESQERLQEDIRQQQSKTGGGGYVVASPPDVRREVLRLAASRERALGEELLGKFKEQKEREAADAKNRRNRFGADAATSQRLSLAGQLVDAGDIERALQFADPVLGGINVQSIEFLTHLRDKDPTAADQRYASMLAKAPTNPESDANTVSLLSSYIFTPHTYVTFQGNGVSSSQMSGASGPANVPAELRAAFFRVAAGILLRPLAPPGQDQTTLGPDGLYLAIRRLMPFFEQYAPQETTTALRAQLEALTAMASDRARERKDDSLRRGFEEPSADREQSLLDQIDHAKTSSERDGLNLQLAMLLARKGDLRARDYVSKIDDSEMRNSARAYIDVSMAMQAVNKKDTDRALEIAKTGELTHLQKAWLMARIAKLLAKTDSDKAMALIEDATTEARRIEPSDPDRPRAFFAVTNALMIVNRGGVWDVMSDAIKAANSAENFSGEDGQLTFKMVSKVMSSVYQDSVADFDVAGIFEVLAKDDYERSVELARGFEREAPRANAVLAIAHSVLTAGNTDEGAKPSRDMEDKKDKPGRN
jgi:hypothetical protein